RNESRWVLENTRDGSSLKVVLGAPSVSQSPELGRWQARSLAQSQSHWTHSCVCVRHVVARPRGGGRASLEAVGGGGGGARAGRSAESRCVGGESGPAHALFSPSRFFSI